MKRKFNYYLLILPLLALFSSCSRDVFDEYYARPDYLENPIYQRLDELGNFKNFRTLIEKAGYKDILSKSGYWTMFAPNDEAFAAYFQEKGISDVTKIDDVTAAKIVRYALVYNAFREDQLSDYQSSQGWVLDNAFRRRTAFYDGYQNKIVNGTPMVVVDANRNGGYFFADNNNKYVTYFTDEYFTAKNLSSFDFNYFYSGKEYTGFNLFDGSVKQADIIAENGIIHEVDKVVLPPLSIAQYLEEDNAKGANSKYSEFYKMLEEHLVTYQFNETVSASYKNFTGKSDDVYIKFYNSGLAFSPNSENYLKEMDNDGQSDAFTMIAPSNAALEPFVRDVLLKHYPSVDKLPLYVFQDFFNAHMVQNAVWPSIAASYTNGLDEDLRFDFNANIIDKKILSNGFFYGSDIVQKSNLFYSVYTSAYLDPAFTLATRLYNSTEIKQMISNIRNKYVLFLPSDTLLRSLGYNYDINSSQWVYTNPATGLSVSGGAASSRLYRILYNSIVATPNGELDNIRTTSGIIRSGDLDFPGEYLKWNNGKISTAGTEAMGNVINIVGAADVQQNGVTYYIDNIFEFTDRPQGLEIKELAEAPGSQFSSFFNYLKNSTVYNTTTGAIRGVSLGTSYTFIVPNNDAITQAVRDGVLPGTPSTGVPNYTPTFLPDIDKIADFISYHILVNATASDDGLVTGQFETLRKDGLGEKTYIQIQSSPGTLVFKSITDSDSSANYIKASSNNLADRSLIHLVDNYIKFSE
ncbi:fasciclin domain-containing protein [Flavobacterium sp. ARAG 55.4]|uniref:fasciclin domain-containing protein n=1 Tax=Flavobacterium sp. ARAG 55.4 TaxID=3451357 RepID=UPI003F485A88